MWNREARRVAGITRWLKPMQLQTEASGACQNPGITQACALHPVDGQNPQLEGFSQWSTAYGSPWWPRLNAPRSLTSAYHPADIAIHYSSTRAPGSTRSFPRNRMHKKNDYSVARSNRARSSGARQPVV
jgi:hypothetical protein